MSAPKHLWSGDWERESELAAQERQRLRARVRADEPTPPAATPVEAPREPRREPRRVRVQPAPRPPARPVRPRRPREPRGGLAAALRALAPSRRALAFGLTALVVIVGAALAISALNGSNGSAASNGSVPFLGVELESVPVNQVLVTAVVPGSPADQAGIEPEDLIVSIDNHPVSAPGDVTNILSHLHAGDRVTIIVQRGALTLPTQAVLATSQGASP